MQRDYYVVKGSGMTGHARSPKQAGFSNKKERYMEGKSLAVESYRPARRSSPQPFFRHVPEPSCLTSLSLISSSMKWWCNLMARAS